MPNVSEKWGPSDVMLFFFCLFIFISDMILFIFLLFYSLVSLYKKALILESSWVMIGKL